jgi:hypothetical protein
MIGNPIEYVLGETAELGRGEGVIFVGWGNDCIVVTLACVVVTDAPRTLTEFDGEGERGEAGEETVAEGLGGIYSAAARPEAVINA